jgi:hypothetical protein
MPEICIPTTTDRIHTLSRRLGYQRWSRLSEQIFRIDKWSLCRGQAAKRSGSGVK